MQVQLPLFLARVLGIEWSVSHLIVDVRTGQCRSLSQQTIIFQLQPENVMSNKLLAYCDSKRIPLTKKQRLAKLPFQIRKIYSSYPTLEGRMFYVKTSRNDLFIHLFSNGHFSTDPGWDGGDLRKIEPPSRAAMG